jgi:hypothetical protein
MQVAKYPNRNSVVCTIRWDKYKANVLYQLIDDCFEIEIYLGTKMTSLESATNKLV